MLKKAILSALCCLALIGCATAPQASNQERVEALAQFRHLLPANHTIALKGVYYLLSIDDDFKYISMDPATGDIKAEFSGTKRFKQALAVAINQNGYLLTARHVLSPYNYVIGDFGAGLSVRRVRIVHQSDTTDKCDYAVIKTEATLPFAFEMAEMPADGDVVFAVVFDKNDQILGGDRLFTAGLIKSTESFAAGTLIDSTVPLRAGDSGGPMLSPEGRLVGITQGWNYTQGVISGKYAILSVRPAEHIIESVIKVDSQRRN